MKHPFAFDPTYGYTLAQLQAIAPPAEPADFDAFWQATYAATLAVRLDLQIEPDTAASAEHRLHKIFFNTLGGLRVGAWLVEPVSGASTMGAVVGHGYGGRSAPEYQRRAMLPYFDAASAATRVRIPTVAAPALFDPAVPPPGQFAVCNALAGPKELVVLSAGHFTYPQQAAENAALERAAERYLWLEAPAWREGQRK